MTGSVEVLFFAKTYENIAGDLVQDNIVVVGGRLRREDESVSIYASDLSVPKMSLHLDHLDEVELLLPAERCTKENMRAFGALLERFPGQAPVRLHILEEGELQVLDLGPERRVNAGPDFLGELRAMLGYDSIITPGTNPLESNAAAEVAKLSPVNPLAEQRPSGTTLFDASSL